MTVIRAARSSHGRVDSGSLYGQVNGDRRESSSQRMATPQPDAVVMDLAARGLGVNLKWYPGRRKMQIPLDAEAEPQADGGNFQQA